MVFSNEGKRVLRQDNDYSAKTESWLAMVEFVSRPTAAEITARQNEIPSERTPIRTKDEKI